MTQFSVVICAHDEDRWEDLQRAVESIRAQSMPPCETIVVVDRNPRLRERVNGLLGVTAIDNTDTPGLGGARNSGLEIAAGSIVAFLDDDAVASEDWLERLSAAYVEPNVLGVGGSIQPLWEAGRPRWFPEEFDWVVGCTYRGMPLGRATVRNLIGCNMSFRRDVLEALDGFRLGYGCDETDLCIRAGHRWPDGKLIYLPTARVFHLVMTERSCWRHFRKRCFFEGGSKAVVSSLVGVDDGLASEWTHVRRTLPLGIMRGLRDAMRGDLFGLARAASILAGLAITSIGYLVGKRSPAKAAVRRGWTAQRATANGSDPERRPALDLSVIVPTRNAEHFLHDCLTSVTRSGPREIIVVDGNSSDRTAEIARSHRVKILSDEGRGLPAARMLAAQEATRDVLLLLDSDVVLPDGSLELLYREFRDGGYDAIQAGLVSESGPGYWGRALANHHRTGRSRGWFGLAATVFNRDLLLEHGLDERFLSGEDIDLRWRLRRAGVRVGVSRTTFVRHQFGDTYVFARDQWLADGHGVGRMLKKQGLRASLLIALPLAAGLRGIALSIARLQFQWIPYYVGFIAFNYLGIVRELRASSHPWKQVGDVRRRSRSELIQLLREKAFGQEPGDQAASARGGRSLSMLGSSFALIVGKVAAMGLGFCFWLVAARVFQQTQVGLAAGAVSAVMLCNQLALVGVGSSVIVLFPAHAKRPSRLLDTSLTTVALSSLGVAGFFFILAGTAFHRLSVVAIVPGFAVAFAAMCVLGTVGILLDQVSTVLRRGDQTLMRALLFGAVNLGAIVPLAFLSHATSALAIFATWVAAASAGVALGGLQLWRILHRYRYRPRIDVQVTRRLLRVGLPNHWLTLMERAPGFILPIIVTELVSPAANAAWYATWMMAWAVYIIPIQIGMTLFAEASQRVAPLSSLIRHGLRQALVLGVVAAAAVAAVGHLILSGLGARYADAGTAPLRLLVIAVVPLTLTQAYFVVCRATMRFREGIAAGTVSAVLSTGGAAVAAQASGLSGIAAAWIMSQTVISIWAAWRLWRLAAADDEVSRAKRRRATGDAMTPAIASLAASVALADDPSTGQSHLR